jgi:hypothetical protein
MATQDTNPQGTSAAPVEGEVLDVRDVLSAVHFDQADADMLGALLTFTTVGDRTIISVDADGNGPSDAVQIASLQGITGITLQQLLSNNLDIAC